MDTIQRPRKTIVENNCWLGSDSSTIIIAKRSIEFANQYPRENLTSYEGIISRIEIAYFWRD